MGQSSLFHPFDIKRGRLPKQAAAKRRCNMLLAFDVGNTNIVLGVFKDGKMVTNWRMETDNRKSADEYGMIIHQLFAYENLDIKEVKDVIISTVVPSILYTLQTCFQMLLLQYL